MRRSSFLAGTGILVALVFGVVSPATAIDDLTIPIDSVVRGDSFETVTVASVTVPADLVGDTCTVTLEAANNNSVHDDNHLIISTGGESVTFPNVESESFQTTTAAGDVTLGESVLVQLQLGEDGVSSGGLSLTFDCAEVLPTTTIAPTTTTEPPTEVLTETTVPAALPETKVEAATAAQPAYTG